MFHRNSKGTRRDAKEEVERKEKKTIGRVPTSMGIAIELRVSVNLGEGWFYGTVGMLYRYVAVLHRRFPLHHGHTPSSTLSSLPLLHHRDPSPTRSLTTTRPLSQSGAQRLRFTVASRSFARSRGIRITRVRYLYPIVRPHAWSTARTHSRAARKWKTSMHEDGVDARVRGITPLASRVSFFFFVLLEFILIVRFWGGLSSYFSFFENVG